MFNRAGEELLGYDRQALLGKNNLDLFPPEQAAHFLAKDREVLNGKAGMMDIPEEPIQTAMKGQRLLHTRKVCIRGTDGTTKYLLGISEDITERKQAEEALATSNKLLKDYTDNSPALIYAVDMAGRFLLINRRLEAVFGVPRTAMIGKTRELFMTPEIAAKHRANDQQVIAHGQPITFEEENEERYGKHTYLSIKFPLFDLQGGMSGICGISTDITERKQAEEERQQNLERLKKAFGTIVQVMSSSVEAKDPYTAGHQLRVADLACAIATEMGLTQDIIEGIRMAGSVHDIGKLSIPAELLTKPSKLTNSEFNLIKEHSLIGYEILKNVESPWPLAQIAYQHHERMNGSGYPRKLKGDEILMEARIMAVADVVEAMASHRPYRAALGIGAALAEIEKNKGTFFDDAVADACLKLFREKGYKLPA
jgi:PAS domain S-box-containing protein